MNEKESMDFVEAARLLADALEISTAEFERVRTALGIGLRRARYFVRVWGAFRTLDVEREVLLAVGWTKLQMIADVLTPKNVRGG